MNKSVANNIILDGPIVYCPYNSQHLVEKSKILTHITRCKDAKKSGKKTEACKNDSSIRFLEENRDRHIYNCQFCKNDFNIFDEISFIKKLDDMSQSINIDISISELNLTLIEDSIEKPTNYTSQIGMIQRNMLYNPKFVNNPNESLFLDKSIINILNEKGKNAVEEQENTILY